MRFLLRFGIWIVMPSLAVASAQPPTINIELVASGLDRPLYVTHVPGDRNRLFIVEQVGRIRIVDRGALLPTPFLDITSRVTCCSERGLLGLAFHPAFQANRSFFVNYISISGDTVVSRFTVPASTPNQADPQSEEVILTIDQPGERHNAGWLDFSPNDGYLYIATGDGAAGGCDGEGDAQDIENNLLGKILRIDVDGGQPYAIPPDNPFVGTAGDDEIWAYGLRNPWRCAFDAVTGDLYINDVGQDTWEEINFQRADSAGGENYGWNCMEGNHCSSDSGCGPGACECFDAGLVRPVHEYDHGAGFAITGGEVYRGCAMSGAQGRFFFGDGIGKVWSFALIGGGVTELVEHTAEFDPGGGLSLGSLASFGRDADGEIYMADINDGEVFKIVPVGPSDCGGPVVPPSPHDRPKNRYISFAPNLSDQLIQFKVTLTASLPHPGLVGSSWWVQQPVTPVPNQFPKPALGAGECVAILGPEATAASIDWVAAGCQVLHVTGCPIEPTSEYEVQAVGGVNESDPLTVATILKPGVKWWGDTVGSFNGTEWTAAQGVTNIDDALAAIKTFQGGQVVAPVGNVAHLSVVDVEPANINTVVNINDVFRIILAFQGGTYSFGPADAAGNCP